MWITSTYLGRPDPDAQAFVYFFWETYASNRAAPERLAEYLRRAGNTFGKSATFLLPNPADTDRISQEVNRGRLKGFASEIQEHAPCLMVTAKSLDEFDPTRDNCLFLRIPPETASDVDIERFFADMHNHVSNKKRESAREPNSFIRRLWDAIEIAPNFIGIGVRLKDGHGINR